ncbi:MAG TPA: STN domain-containing protein [Planctomycetota bacterium]|nr:STN domain-containing protein [Planctomycetota bacterium]
MPSRPAAALFAALLVCSSAHALQFPQPVRPGQEPWRKPFNAALEKKVSGDVKKPFDELIDWFREQAGVTFVVDPAALASKPVVTLNAKDIALGSALKQVLTPLKLEYEVRDMAIFIYNPAKLDKNMLLPEDLPIAKMLDNRAEMLNFEPEAMPAGEAIKQLTETPGIKMGMDESLKKNPVTLKLKEIGLGYAIRWTVRMAGGKIIVGRDGMQVVKR